MSAPPASPKNTLRWDIFCRVVDNLGDVGVCWRLAADLAERGHRVRLVIDDPSALAWMAPAGQAGVQMLPWPASTSDTGAWAQQVDVAIEAFGCDPPPAYAQALGQRTQAESLADKAPPAVWINLEYLSAEPYVERSHGLPSWQPSGALKWFFFPGFTARTGGLIRELGLMARQQAFRRSAWLAQHRLSLQTGERLVSLFCYDTATLPGLLQSLAGTRCLVLLAGPQAKSLLAPDAASPPAGVRLQAMPWLSHAGFDDMLWASDLNFVRGEDSLVRAIWAGKPFVWQAYPQHDDAHHAKVRALLAQHQPGAAVQAGWLAWNGIGETPLPPEWPPLTPWMAQVQAWRAQLLAQPSLSEQLQAFVHARRRPSG